MFFISFKNKISQKSETNLKFNHKKCNSLILKYLDCLSPTIMKSIRMNK